MRISQSPSDHSLWTRPGSLLIAALALIVLALAAGGDGIRLLTRYDRTQLEAGQLWRLVSGHLAHLGWGHAAMNLAAVVLIGVAFGRLLSPLRWLIVASVAALSIDAGLWFFEPAIGWYVGLSGVLHGLVAAAGIVLLVEAPGLGLTVLAALAAKLAWESVSGGLPFTAALSGGDVIVEAHLWGAVGGGLAALLLRVLIPRVTPV